MCSNQGVWRDSKHETQLVGQNGVCLGVLGAVADMTAKRGDEGPGKNLTREFGVMLAMQAHPKGYQPPVSHPKGYNLAHSSFLCPLSGEQHTHSASQG